MTWTDGNENGARCCGDDMEEIGVIGSRGNKFTLLLSTRRRVSVVVTYNFVAVQRTTCRPRFPFKLRSLETMI
jgi:hypothetical protein